jgi:hypothetical protein
VTYERPFGRSAGPVRYAWNKASLDLNRIDEHQASRLLPRLSDQPYPVPITDAQTRASYGRPSSGPSQRLNPLPVMATHGNRRAVVRPSASKPMRSRRAGSASSANIRRRFYYRDTTDTLHPDHDRQRQRGVFLTRPGTWAAPRRASSSSPTGLCFRPLRYNASINVYRQNRRGPASS